MPTILPQWGNAAFLGNYNAPFWAVYSRELYSLGAAVYSLSDSRLKTNIVEISNGYALQKVLGIKTYNFDFRDTLNIIQNTDSLMLSKVDNTNQTGFIAQQIKDVLPHLVKTDENGFYNVNYVGLVPYLLAAIKEQQLQIDTLKNAVYGADGNH